MAFKLVKYFKFLGNVGFLIKYIWELLHTVYACSLWRFIGVLIRTLRNNPENKLFKLGLLLVLYLRIECFFFRMLLNTLQTNGKTCVGYLKEVLEEDSILFFIFIHHPFLNEKWLILPDDFWRSFLSSLALTLCCYLQIWIFIADI